MGWERRRTHAFRAWPETPRCERSPLGETVLRETKPEIVYFPAADPNVDRCEREPAKSREANVVPALSMLKQGRGASARRPDLSPVRPTLASCGGGS